MSKVRPPVRPVENDDRHAWRVVDDLDAASPIGTAELDAVETFLMPLLNAILRGEDSVQGRARKTRIDAPPLAPLDSTVPQNPEHDEDQPGPSSWPLP
jgi:hypothetical protein